MYIPKHFQQSDKQELHKLIRQQPLATLVASTEQGLLANHLPLLAVTGTEGNLTLKGHVARANSLWEAAIIEPVLAIFHGPDAYISPSYYPSKKDHGKVVPTWNYVAVHACGTISFFHDSEWKLEFLNALTNQHEAQRSEPWAVSDAPKEFVNGQLGAIVGFEIKVDELLGKWKVSQNHPQRNRYGVRDGLTASAHHDANLLSGETE